MPKTKKKTKKTTSPKKTKVKTEKKPKKSSGEYYQAVGRRKTSIARVRLFTCRPNESVAGGNLKINGKPYKKYFPGLEFQKIVEAPFQRLKSLNRFRVTIKVRGGGTRGQAEAIRHGIARALTLFDSNFRKKLKKVGYLTRDPRKKERKKFGRKKARRSPQWSKR